MGAVRHLVAFRVPDARNLEGVIDILRTFTDMDGVSSMRVERDLGLHPRAYDVLLVSEHDSVEDLARFRRDPEHLLAADRLSELADARVTIDHLIG